MGGNSLFWQMIHLTSDHGSPRHDDLAMAGPTGSTRWPARLSAATRDKALKAEHPVQFSRHVLGVVRSHLRGQIEVVTCAAELV